MDGSRGGSDDDFVAAVCSVPLGGAVERSGSDVRRDHSQRRSTLPWRAFTQVEVVEERHRPEGEAEVSASGTCRSSLTPPFSRVQTSGVEEILRLHGELALITGLNS